MRYIKFITGLLIIMSFGSCIREDLLTDCICNTQGQFLYFSYKGDGTSEILTEKIKDVDLYVFDHEEKLVLSTVVSSDSLEKNHGTRLNLPQGEYTLVALANTGERTQVSDLETGDLNMIHFAHPGFFQDDETMLTGNDPNYLGRIQLSVEGENVGFRDTMNFESSHMKVYLEIAGYETTTTPGKQGESLTVEMRNMPCRVFFDNRICPQRRNYYPEIEKQDNKDLYVGQLCTFRLDDKHPAQIALYAVDSAEPFYTLDVEEFLKDNPEIDISKQEAELPLRIEIKGKDVSVGVTVPDWSIEDVFPDIDFED